MIVEKLMHGTDLTESEKQIAKFILNRDNDIDNLTSTELGKRGYTSQSTVIRLYKKLGMKTYREFLSLLIIERNEYFKSEDLTNEFSEMGFSSYSDIKSTIPKIYTQAMINTNLLIDRNVLIRVCNRISNARITDIYGVGISNTIAEQFCFKLQSLGIYCIYHSAFNTYYVNNIKDCKNKVALIISLNEDDGSILEIVKQLKKDDIYTACICDKTQNSLIEKCEDILSFSKNQFNYMNMINSFFAIEYICNLIFSLLLSRKQLK